MLPPIQAPARQRMIPTIVFHWQRTYSQAAQIQAVLDGREPTIDDMIADGRRQPIYRFSAFAVPVPSVQRRHRFCRLIETAGFRKDKKSAILDRSDRR